MKITDFDARLLRYLMAEFGVDRHSFIELRKAFICSVGRLALKHFRELDADDPDFVTWDGEHIAIGGHPDPEYRRATKDRLRAHRRSSYFVRRYGAQVRHIVDWFDIATRRNHAWLGNVDDKGRPKKLMKCASIEQLHREAEKQLRIIAQQQKQNAPLDTNNALTSTDIKWTATIADDLHLVQLLSPEALDEESQRMGHCIGLGAYDTKVVGDQRRFSYWSVRNDDGVPLATLEVREKVVVQLSDRGNGYAPRPVREAVERYMEAVGWTYTRPEIADTDGGRIQRGSDYYHLQRLFENPATLEDLRAFQRLADVDQIRVIDTLKEAAGLGPDDEVPRRRDPVVQIVHDGVDFVELITDDPGVDEGPGGAGPR